MDKELLKKLSELNKKLKKDGFVIDGVFGSYARGEEKINSDIDLLYHLEEEFLKKYPGFIGFKKLEEIKEFLKRELNMSVDLAPKNNLSNTAKKYIFKDLINV